ncbi:hypothetical protein QFZ60_001542 [Arthrobacter sp. B2I5]|uniref:hypothetical protein n=1 Tax=Arthrobacter sp. B2I5 TaxID=3042266 RepID=UPI00278851A2|nr:hypothetical protein [Arthrobacter sp. B2I5]MDQ0825369.1 hypothetical protein [Arthrobacter sp. B2I5]
MNEHLPINQEQPVPQEHILFRSHGEHNEAEPILEAIKAAPALYAIAPDGSAIQLDGTASVRYSDIKTFSVDDEGVYLYLKALDGTD